MTVHKEKKLLMGSVDLIPIYTRTTDGTLAVEDFNLRIHAIARHLVYMKVSLYHRSKHNGNF
ncbi:hypothetical protein [Methanothermobacter sp.]|uniref:hypothetical protein n=1 Tax=Methanothermobacter sp. TaxID=1884223 RepID=UPI00262ECDCE|nr:hypothetical protein [Methanothermobacter sp.]